MIKNPCNSSQVTSKGILTTNADPKLPFRGCVGDPVGLPWEEEGAEPAGLPCEDGGAEMLSRIPPFVPFPFPFPFSCPLLEPFMLFLWLVKKEMGLMRPEE